MSQRKHKISKKIGDRIKVHGSPGTIKFLGETKFSPGLWIGIELDRTDGNNNGSINGTPYFVCKEKHGLFIKYKRNEKEQEQEQEQEQEKGKGKGKENQNQDQEKNLKNKGMKLETNNPINTNGIESNSNPKNQVQKNIFQKKTKLSETSRIIQKKRLSPLKLTISSHGFNHANSDEVSVKLSQEQKLKAHSDDNLLDFQIIEIPISPKTKSLRKATRSSSMDFTLRNRIKRQKGRIRKPKSADSRFRVENNIDEKKKMELLKQISKEKVVNKDHLGEIQKLKLEIEKRKLQIEQIGPNREMLQKSFDDLKKIEKKKKKIQELKKSILKKKQRNKSLEVTLDHLQTNYQCENEIQIINKIKDLVQVQKKINQQTESEFELNKHLEKEKNYLNLKLSKIFDKIQLKKDKQTRRYTKTIQKIVEIEKEKKTIFKNLNINYPGNYENFFRIQDEINYLNKQILTGQRKIRELEKTRNFFQNKHTEILPNDKNNKSRWIAKLMNTRPEIFEMKEQLRPIYKNSSFGRIKTAERVLNYNCITSEDILQLIMQHYQTQEKYKITKFIEKKTGVKYYNDPQQESNLINLIKIGCREDNQSWDLTKNKTEDNSEIDSLEVTNDKELNVSRNIVMDLDVDDVNIWDEEEDNKMNLQILPKLKDDYEKGDFLNTIHLANINKLIAHLIHPINNDEKYNQAFLMTYRSFIKPEHLFLKIKQRYRVPEINDYKDKIIFYQMRINLQKKVISVLDYWLMNHFVDFSPILFRAVILFLENETMKDFPKESKSVLANIKLHEENRCKNKIFNIKHQNIKYQNRIISPRLPPEIIVPSNLFSFDFGLVDVDPIELARQMTLFSHQLYQKIPSSELIEQSWNKSKKERHKLSNVMKMINNFNQFSRYVMHCIVSQTNIESRANEFIKWIKIAKYLCEIQNYECLMIILVALDKHCCKRLKATKEEIPKKYLTVLVYLKEVMSSDQGFKKYREFLSVARTPTLPYISVFLTDLTYIADNSPNKIDGLINFSKCKLLYNVICEIKKYQSENFIFTEIYQIHQLFKKGLTKKNEKELYEISLKNEPRSTSSSDIN
ncbi:guanine nucleotide exchange factor [Anaeramoeba flamelloides]|uniref:Guanine nucleotide exchange factor n=1 Tax=Anaeramoeba flamelloides TaxID=1746091 RepID=A0ABQ8XI88_9EUKA|nr:guanine nucleotide exchange factor [Anaeramoeba flamelloides]